MNLKLGLLLNLKAICSPAAGCPLAGAVTGAVAGIVVLGGLDSANEFGLFHRASIDSEVFGLFLDFGH
jgi:hypothetical protein